MQGLKVVGHRATKVCIMLDGCALASVRVARGLESALWVGGEFVVFVFSVVRHVDINLPRFANRGVRVGEFGAHERPQVGQGRRLGRAIPCWKGGLPKTFSDALRAYKSPSPGRANSLVHLPYPKAQCAHAQLWHSFCDS